MENYKAQELPKANKNTNPNAQIQNKILRSKSKNIYIQQKHIKQKINSNIYVNPKIAQNNNIINNKQDLAGMGYNKFNNNKKILRKNSKNEIINKKSDFNELKSLKEENVSLKLASYRQDEKLKELHNLFIHNYNKINALKNKYLHLKKFLKKTLYEDNNDNFLKEKIEEEIALRAVEQQIMNEICPNPDQMSYEQLLELEEGVGNVNKGLSKDKINQIPSKPFHMALFDDNTDCIICMEKFSENELVKQLPCGHIFHGECIDHWLTQQKNCPFCKAECNINFS